MANKKDIDPIKPAQQHAQQAMKEKSRQMEEQRQSRANQQEPHGKMDQHPIRKQG